MKKKNSKLSGFYLGLIFVLMYLPIAVVIVFSFNESKLPVRFTGFSLKWYQELIHDDAMIEALGNSLFLGVVSCLVSAVIGTLGAVGLSRIHWKTKGILEYISILPLMIPEIILGMVLMAFFYMMNLPFGMLTLLIGHTVFCVPYILMEVKARLAGMDPSLEEAARDLGAGPFRAFWDIILPLIMPAVLSGSLLALQCPWTMSSSVSLSTDHVWQLCRLRSIPRSRPVLRRRSMLSARSCWCLRC